MVVWNPEIDDAYGWSCRAPKDRRVVAVEGHDDPLRAARELHNLFVGQPFKSKIEQRNGVDTVRTLEELSELWRQVCVK